MRLVRTELVAVAYLLLVVAMVHGQGTLAINGSATYRERIALPADAVFEAMLEDVSRADSVSRVISRSRVERPGNPPFQFTISYDPGQIVPNHIYSVRARITEGERLLFTTDQRYQVLTQGHGSEIGMMMLRSVSAPTTAPSPSAAGIPLRETNWKLVQLEGKSVSAGDQQREPNLTFHTAENRITGFGGCNRFSGTYMADSRALRFNGVASTQMACDRGMDTEMAFLGMLEKVRTWKITNQQLEFYDANDKVLARFTVYGTK